MAAAYAALVSVRHIIEQIQHHPRPPISLEKTQVESLTEKVTFLQDFLENYSLVDRKQADALESRIADAAYAAEDIIESHIVDQIQASTHGERISSVELYQGLQKVIQGLDLIMKEVAEIKENIGIQLDQLQRISMSVGSLRRSPSSTRHNIMVGFDDVLIKTMDKLTGQQSSHQIIPIVGMGGIGKTTLARNIYENPLIVQHFDILVWVTISQEYSVREILLESLLCQKDVRGKEYLSGKSEHEVGELLYKSLSGRRYLIILDDLWSVDAWDSMKFFFPDNNNGSRILITTRLSIVALYMTDSDDVLKMKFLDEGNSWNLFCRSVFGEEGCPLELEETGKKIAKSCKGLPLSITVIGGLLSKYKRSPEYWEYILENLNPILNSEDNEHCLKILRMSYKELPVHLKPCFLYMGVFPEDHNIYISRLIKLWVAEGFLKPISGKSLEIAAEEYLKDLLDRNLILVHKLGSTGKIEYCKIHDLLRDLSLKEAQKDKFLCFKSPYDLESPQDIQSQRRVGFHQSTRGELIGSLQSASLRSLICDFAGGTRRLPLFSCRLLRVLMAPGVVSYNEENYSPETIFDKLANSRLLQVVFNHIPRIPSSVCCLWNLQTLVVRTPHRDVVAAPVEIWEMAQLRHVMIYRLELPDIPPIDDDAFIVLGNLQTLERVRNFKCGEAVVKRIPYIKKLVIYYEKIEELPQAYCLDNLCRLCELESLSCDFGLLNEASRSNLALYLSFPHSLGELILNGSNLHWEDVIMTKIGSLPNLQVLELKWNSFIGPEWVTVEGQFCRLKFLLIEDCGDLQYWRTDNTHFPCLEHLVLRYLDKLEEIPLEIGDIPTLKSIELKDCSESSVVSAKKIAEEQDGLGNVGLQVVVHDAGQWSFLRSYLGQSYC